ncbi:hypothetical protein CMI47_02050 [Candidatus Pacearchaeota archaeon]|jgi:hypothetical protein|nr:hypothetical protein [Candidatus Pacearchaeota archaeon]|tara:strand:+ start:2033 stop:2560 length:528 start_codon:yes stop_codon:yes gene_type:complete
MNYLKDIGGLLDILSSSNKAFIHLYSSQTYYTEELDAIHGISRDLIKEYSFGGICFEIESPDIYKASTEIGPDCYMPIIRSEIGDDTEGVLNQAITDFSVPKNLGILICSIDRPFLTYKSLVQFPHHRCRFDYMIVYHGWGVFQGSRYPFMDIFNKFNYTVSYEDDFIYIMKKAH